MHIQLFTKSQLLLSLLLATTCILGDVLVHRNSHSRLLKAICDNLTHAIVGLLAASLIINDIKYYTTFDEQIRMLVTCFAASSLIDMDHFIAARSWRLIDASHLSKRPFLHCTTIPLILFAILLYLLLRKKLYRLCLWITIFLCALFTHHTRDATRRGYWIYPFGHTRPVPYILYILLTIVIPHAFTLLLNATLTTRYQTNNATFFHV